MLQSLESFHQWLQYISRTWLRSNSNNSVCAKLNDTLSTLSHQLINAGYSEVSLNTITNKYSTSNCDQHARQRLKNLNVAPFGRLFVEAGNGKLMFSNTLQRWSEEMAAIEKLNVFSYQTATMHDAKIMDKKHHITAWDIKPLNEAIDLLVNLQQFTQKWWQGHRDPFYATALTLRLQTAVSALIQQSAVEKDPGVNQISILGDNEDKLSESIASFQAAENAIQQLYALYDVFYQFYITLLFDKVRLNL